MEIQEILRKIGFSKHESKVYVALLERGAMNISDVCRTADIHRPAAYSAIRSLKTKSLISEAPHGKRVWYAAESPSQLRTEIDVLARSLQSAIPLLNGAYEKRGHKPVIRFFEGKTGIVSVFDDMVESLKKGDVFYRYSSLNAILTDGDKYISARYRRIRDEKQLERLVITNQRIAQGKKPRLEREMKIIPPSYDPFDYNITQIIYGNKTAFVDYNTDTALIIENAKIAEFLKKLFKLLYSKL